MVELFVEPIATSGEQSPTCPSHVIRPFGAVMLVLRAQGLCRVMPCAVSIRRTRGACGLPFRLSSDASLYRKRAIGFKLMSTCCCHGDGEGRCAAGASSLRD